MYNVPVLMPGLAKGLHDFCSGIPYLTAPVKYIQGVPNCSLETTILYLFQLSSVRMQGLLLLIFVKHVHLPFIRDIHTHYTRTGLYGYWVKKQPRFDCLNWLLVLMMLCASKWFRGGREGIWVT